MAGSGMDDMTDAHRQLLQAFMSRGIMDAKEVKNQFRYACERNNIEGVNPSMIVEMITTINKPIKTLHLEIKKAISEDTGGHFYGLVNTVESDITRLSSLYTVAECEFFKKLIENIVESYNGSLSSSDALNLVTSLPEGVKMTISEAENLVKRMKDDKWLLESDGQISLSTRTILEMEGYIREQHSDSALNCEMCKKLCLKGQNCSSCDVKLHFHCAKTLFKNQPRPSCPNKKCGSEWQYALPERPRDGNMSQSATGSGGSPMEEDGQTQRSRRR